MGRVRSTERADLPGGACARFRGPSAPDGSYGATEGLGYLAQTRVVEPDGTQLSKTLISTVEFDGLGRKKLSTAPGAPASDAGDTVEYTRNQMGLVTEKVTSEMSGIFADTLSVHTGFRYDPLGRPEQVL